MNKKQKKEMLKISKHDLALNLQMQIENSKDWKLVDQKIVRGEQYYYGLSLDTYYNSVYYNEEENLIIKITTNFYRDYASVTKIKKGNININKKVKRLFY